MCGRREREAGAGRSRGVILEQLPGRDGERHPGPRDGDALRGAASEHGPRSVSRSRSRSPPLRTPRLTTAGARRAPRKGTSSAYAAKACATRSVAEKDTRHLEDTSFAWSFGPFVSPFQTCERHRGRANCVSRGTGTGVFRRGANARLAAPHPRKSAWERQEKEGGAGLRPCEETRARASARTSFKSLQKSVGGVRSRIRSRVSAPKRAAAGVNGDLGEGIWRRSHVERPTSKRRPNVGRAPRKRCRTGADPTVA
jgi:hypothetical protein